MWKFVPQNERETTLREIKYVLHTANSIYSNLDTHFTNNLAPTSFEFEFIMMLAR